MRATLRAVSARLIVGHPAPDQASELLDVVEPRDKPALFGLAEPDGIAVAAPVPAGAPPSQHSQDGTRLGKLVLETVANEYAASARADACDAVVDGLRVAHHRLGPDGLALARQGSPGVGFAAAAIVGRTAQLVIVPPAQAFVLHQGIVRAIPESSALGRSIWMREDLRPEIYAGVGGVHEPDIQIYEIGVGPGDTLVLLSSALARMFNEDDLRTALGYEEAAAGADRLKRLAIQRGVDGGLALVIEIAGSLVDGDAAGEEIGPPGDRRFSLASGIPRGRLRASPGETPPIGAVFSTARDWLLDAMERLQARTHTGDSRGTGDDVLEDDVAWPTRPPLRTAQTFAEDHASVQADPPRTPPMDGVARPSTFRRNRPNVPEGLKVDVSRAAAHLTKLTASLRSAVAPGRSLGKRPGGRSLLIPALIAVAVLCVLVVSFRAVKAQQARQLDQRFTSLVSAAQQLETQARGDADRNEAQSLIQRAQALLQQAATLKHDQSSALSLRQALQSDLDRLDNIFELPDPVVLAQFGNGTAKGADPQQVVGDNTALYVLDGAQQKIYQVMRVQRTVTPIVSKGDKVGPNQIDAPQQLAMRDSGSLVILDANRKLWEYVASKNALGLVGLKGSESWKSAKDLAAYGANVYVLDTAGGNIFRYVPKDGQYADTPSRFFDTDNKAPLGRAVSMAIDGSIWVLNADGQILKLAGGQPQPFSVSGLSQPISKPVQIFAAPDVRSLYVLDAGENRIVQLSKDGAYQRQFRLNLSAPASSFWLDELNRGLYVLSGGKLYAYQLPV